MPSNYITPKPETKKRKNIVIFCVFSIAEQIL